MKRLVMACALSVFITSGCSNHWREGDAQISGEEMLQILGEVQTGSSLMGGNVSQVLQLKDDPATAIYFADAPGSLGPVASVLSLFNFEFLGQPDLAWDSITQARVFFLDRPADGGRQTGLIIGIGVGGGSLSYYGFSGTGSIENGEFVAQLSGGQKNITLRSYDIEGGDLSGTIQLQVYDVDAAGNERYIGKFSTLVGFGG